MSVREFALKIGLTKEELILILIQAAIVGIFLAMGIGRTEPNGKLPL